MEDKKPDSIVWSPEEGYSANRKEYPTTIGAPKFDLPNVPLFRETSSKKMMSVFNQEMEEIKDNINRLYEEYNTSIMVWEAKISFEPTVGKTYHLYNFDGVNTLSLISPNEWNRHDEFLGSFTLNSDNKWIRQNR